MGVGRESPLSLPLHNERPPGSGVTAFKARALPHGRLISCPVTLLSLLSVLVLILRPLHALPLPTLSLPKYVMAFSNALALPPTNIFLSLHVSKPHPSAILFN